MAQGTWFSILSMFDWSIEDNISFLWVMQTIQGKDVYLQQINCLFIIDIDYDYQYMINRNVLILGLLFMNNIWHMKTHVFVWLKM